MVWLSATRQALAGERERARTDALTGILNQDGFAEAARREIGRGRRHGHFLTLGYVDCDDFKAVNDSRGHAEGDALLREVARVLATSVRSDDVVGRIGGDEFVLLMPEVDPRKLGKARRGCDASWLLRCSAPGGRSLSASASRRSGRRRPTWRLS